MKQIIFVVETNNSNKSDDRYIKRLYSERYESNSNEVKYQFCHMGGKGKYNNKSTLSQINKLLKENKKGENIVIYCFDTDKIDSSQEANKVFNEEKSYCDNKGYELVWFYYDIEYTLLGKCIESNMKKQESIKFLGNKKITIDIQK